MKVGVYFCNCGSNVSASIDIHRAIAEVAHASPESYVAIVDFACSGEGKEFLKSHILENKPERVVIAACSPREYENAFMQVLVQADMNPYFLQMVNIREQVAWVTPDPAQATQKACTWIRGAIARVALHQPLEKKELHASPDALVIGAGPAGLQAALFLAQAGRKVTLVEKTPVLGGLPVRYEELFPTMECGPCLLEPVQAEILHGDYAHNIEILFLSEVCDVTGYYGNFNVKIAQTPRFIDPNLCIGCGMCIPPCPVTSKNEFNCGMSEKKAMAMPFLGALPNLPFLDPQICLRTTGDPCQLCLDACPVQGAVRLEDNPQTIERNVGAIIVAIGSQLYDCRKVSSLGYGLIPDVYTNLEFERIASANGPTAGQIQNSLGIAPRALAIIHCVGSLDPNHQPHCSGICCESAFKFNRILQHKLPDTRIYHLYRELVAAGKDDFPMLQSARKNPHATFLRYQNIADLKITSADGGQEIAYTDAAGNSGVLRTDMVVLCPAIVGGQDAAKLASLMDLNRSESGFFEELNGRLHSAQSKVKGIYLAGTCQAPKDIRESADQAMAAAGYILSGLAPGKKLTIEPITASVDESRCSGCRICGNVCPYKAISFLPATKSSSVNALLCHGCGTCVAACPSGAINGNHFTNNQISAEIEAILQ
jgi:heterodisulfide reductase subunit A2